MKSKKGLLGTPWIMFGSFLVIIVIFLTFFGLFSYENSKTKVLIKMSEEKSGDTVFLIGLLRTEMDDYNTTLSEIISKYDVNIHPHFKNRFLYI